MGGNSGAMAFKMTKNLKHFFQGYDFLIVLTACVCATLDKSGLRPDLYANMLNKPARTSRLAGIRVELRDRIRIRPSRGNTHTYPTVKKSRILIRNSKKNLIRIRLKKGSYNVFFLIIKSQYNCDF